MWKHHGYRKNPVLIAILIILGLIAASAFVLLIIFAFEHLWNYLLPGLFGAKFITFAQAAGLAALIAIVGALFGAFRHNNRHGKYYGPGPSAFRNMKWRHHFMHDREHWAGDEWNIRGGWRNWRYFDDWWKQEGKKQYEDYLDKQKPENGERDDDNTGNE